MLELLRQSLSENEEEKLCERETDEGAGLLKILFWVNFVFDIIRKKSVKGVDHWVFMLVGFSQFSSCHLSEFNHKIP